jgi:hypothetical protein
MGLMPSHRPSRSAYGLKAICIFPENPARGLDAHQGGVFLFDGETGEPRALLDASAVTAAPGRRRSRRSRLGPWRGRTRRSWRSSAPAFRPART